MRSAVRDQLPDPKLSVKVHQVQRNATCEHVIDKTLDDCHELVIIWRAHHTVRGGYNFG